MRFALVNNERCEAEPKLKGLCPYCHAPVIAKCGAQKINHWAHKSLNDCDKWWENETNWHLAWKDKFPKEYQEIVMNNDITKEKHIADVHLPNGLTIEFQHSSITPQERLSREKFYKDMVWVVDGTRRKRDFSKFLKGRTTLISHQPGVINIYKFYCSEEIITNDWSSSTVPVVFDFLGMPKQGDLVDTRRLPLYCFLPQKVQGQACFFEITRETFIYNTVNNGWQIFTKRQMDILEEAAKFVK